MNNFWVYLKKIDWVLFSAVIILACFGLIEIYSIVLGQETTDLLNFKKQLFFVAIGIVCLFFFSFLDHSFLKNSRLYLYFLAIALLVGVLVFGASIRGTRGWFLLGGFNFQPIELVKIILLLCLSYFFASRPTKIRTTGQFIFSGLIALPLIALTFLQPDFGSGLVLAFIWLAMLFISGFNKKYFIFILLAAAIIGSVAWFSYFKDYQKQRIMTFLNPQADVMDRGYNVSQALIAVGSGGWMGRGVGFGSQSQLKFLPEAQNDFIFAVIAEELGFLGVSLVLFFFLVFFARCLLAARKINNDFGVFFILGAVGLIFIEMFVNIGMNLGILPVVGISLPFISYGGSSIISTFILIGIIQNIIIESKLNY